MIKTFILNLFIYIIAFLCNSLALFKNPIYSVFCFLNIVLIVVLLLFSLNIYYLSLILLIIYAGGIVVLFLFLIITLIKNYRITYSSTFMYYNTHLLFFFFFLNLGFSLIFYKNNYLFSNFKFGLISVYSNLSVFKFNLKYYTNDIYIISKYLFTDYFIFLFMVILILLFVLISVIVVIKKNFVLTDLTKKYIKINKWKTFNKKND